MLAQYPRASIPETEVRTLFSSLIQQDYEIQIALPPGYKESEKTYPTLYMLDANWLFDMTANVVRLIAFDQQTPHMIIVGIGYPGKWLDTPDRRRDYVPLGWSDDPLCGGADPFLRFIREELIPFAGSAYRVDPHDRCFWGDSLGGLFGLHVLFSQPDTFTRYILGSPWIDQDNHPVFQYERDYAEHHADLPVRVFMAAGSQEFPFVIDNLGKLAGLLQGRSYANLKLVTHIFEGETHVSVMPFNLSKGIRAVYC